MSRPSACHRTAMCKLVQVGGTDKTITRKTEVAQHRGRSCWKIGSSSSTSWHRAKRSLGLPRNTTKPLDLPRNLARFCIGLQRFARPSPFRRKPRNHRTLDTISEYGPVQIRDQEVKRPQVLMFASPWPSVHGSKRVFAGTRFSYDPRFCGISTTKRDLRILMDVER